MFSITLRILFMTGVLWQSVRPGVWQTEFPFAKDGPLAYVRVVALRLDPAVVDFRLHSATGEYGVRSAWSVDSLPLTGVAAFNTGHFRGVRPWGWLVMDGVETQAPGSGPLAMAFVVDSSGRPALVTGAELPRMRGRVRIAFQSYPALLVDGELPWHLQAEGRGVNLEHNDSRLALCIDKTGSVIVAITRFAGLGRKGETFPFGPTIADMVPLMRSLGCRRAMLLDGGISSQLAVRNASGELNRWSNWRMVPLGLVVTPRN